MGDPNQYSDPNNVVTESVPVAAHELVAQAALEVSRLNEDLAKGCLDDSPQQMIYERIAWAFMSFAERLEPE